MSRKSITGSSSNISSPVKTMTKNGLKGAISNSSRLNRSLDKDREGRKMTKSGKITVGDSVLKRSESQVKLATPRSS